uniref:Uncharacterized protein n=1 Tax=Panagrolaimus superbus TaxID=310955 RepID=A0A914YUM4_9BILA
MSHLRIEATYVDETTFKNDEDYMISTFTRRELLPPNLNAEFSKNDFTDLPEHWKYLENFLLINKFPFGHAPTEIIIVEKYKSLAIGFNYNLAKRPVVLYRHCYKYFKNIKKGDIVKVKLGKMYLHVEEQPTIIFTDLYCLVIHSISPFWGYEIISSNKVVEVKNLTFHVTNIKRINQFHVIYAAFGAVVIPSELSNFLCTKISEDIMIVGTVRYCIHGLSHRLYACWELNDTFNVYKNEILFIKCIKGNFILEFAKRRRIAFYNGKQKCRMVEKRYVEEEEALKIFKIHIDLSFVNLENFVKLKPEKEKKYFPTPLTSLTQFFFGFLCFIFLLLFSVLY